MHRTAAFLVVLALSIGACTRAPRDQAEPTVLHAGGQPDTSTAGAIALDRPEHMVVPLAGAGTLTLERVSVERSQLDRARAAPQVPVSPAEPSLEPPTPDPGEPPPAESAPGPADARLLQPPIPRGAPPTSIAGGATGSKRGRVTLDVRVDESGDVSDALLVESDADSFTVRAAIDAAMAIRYHPALLGGRPIAVWTRQVFEVQRSRGSDRLR